MQLTGQDSSIREMVFYGKINKERELLPFLFRLIRINGKMMRINYAMGLVSCNFIKEL